MNRVYMPDSQPYHLTIMSASGSWSYKLTKLQIIASRQKEVLHTIFVELQEPFYTLNTEVQLKQWDLGNYDNDICNITGTIAIVL